jgi:predicted ATPase
VIGAARDLGALLARCPGVVILATSRTVLGLQAEREYPVPPLPLPTGPAVVPVAQLAASPAVALFVDRARALRPGFTLTAGNAAAVAEICRRLEGLPLAIELAAARTRLLDPRALLRRLAASFDALGAGAVDLPERQQTLRATVEWSVGLDDAERSLLETMAVFVDGWAIEAAAQVAGLDEDRALETSEALARHSLIYLDSGEPGPRSQMLETIRAFVAERLAARPDAGEIGRRHAGYYRRWPSGRTGRCAAPATADCSTACRPKRATLPPQCAGTRATTPRRCRSCSGSCGRSGSCASTWPRHAAGSASCCRPPTRSARRPAPN